MRAPEEDRARGGLFTGGFYVAYHHSEPGGLGERLRHRARETWERFFSPERMLETLGEPCLEIDERGGRPASRRTVVAARARWSHVLRCGTPRSPRRSSARW